MSFDRRDIRKAMDVYTLDNVYLGTVLNVLAGPPSSFTQTVAPPARETSNVNGELLGPMPTQTIGNTGPNRQSAAAAYATTADGAQPLGEGSLVVGRWWGLVGRRTIPLATIQTVSLERVVLKLRKDELLEG
jgi:hypothetical protein